MAAPWTPSAATMPSGAIPTPTPTGTPAVQHTDAVGAVTLAFSVLVALYHRNKTGEGQWIDISQVESFVHHLSRPIMDYMMNRRHPRSLGNRDYFMAPHGCYRCRWEDEWVVITVSTDGEWKAFSHAMGDPGWTSRPEFSDPLTRYTHQDEMDSLIQEWTSHRDKKEVMRLLQEAGVPAEAVLNDKDVYADPHLEARGFFETMAHPVIGEYRYPGYLWKFSKTYEPFRIPPNTYGEHNEYVYGNPDGDEWGKRLRTSKPRGS